MPKSNHPLTLSGGMSLNEWAAHCHVRSAQAGWWQTDRAAHPEDICALEEATKVALIHSEVSEMLEGMRKGVKDDHLPERDMAEVECCDALIRIFDLAGRMGWDLDMALRQKLQYNAQRADHKLANRQLAGGKKF